MTKTLTTDELRQIVETDHTQCGDASAMARELLASREAQPVAWTSQRALDTKCKIVAFTDDMSAIEHGVANGWKDIVELYTAPPAPAVPSCFLELLKHAGGMAMGTDWNSGTAAKYHRTKLCKAVEACRAAMLAQPVSQGYKLVPLEPTEEMCNVQHIGVDVYTGMANDGEYYSIGGSDAAKVYRAMLAKSPEGGK